MSRLDGNTDERLARILHKHYRGEALKKHEERCVQMLTQATVCGQNKEQEWRRRVIGVHGACQ